MNMYTKLQLEKMWEQLEDIPMNPVTEQIEEPFLDFPVGTFREDIWYWFDERYPGGVHALMFREV